MAVRIKDPDGNVIAEFDHEPTQQEIDSALGLKGSEEDVWKRTRMGLPDEPYRLPEPPAMGTPKEEPSVFAEGRKPLQPRDVKNWIKAGGAAAAEVSSIPFQEINKALAKDENVGAVEEATRRAFPRGKEWEDKGQGYQSAQDLVMALPNMLRSGMEMMKEFAPQGAEYVSAAARPAARAGFGLPIDPRTWLLAFMPAGAVARLLGTGFTIEMLAGGAEEQKRAQDLLRKEGLTPDAIEALSGAALNYLGAGALARHGARSEMELRRQAGKAYIDLDTGHIMRPIERVTKEGAVEPPEGLPVGDTTPSPEDIVDAEVLAREGVREPARQLERGPLTTPWEYPDSAAADTGYYPRQPGAPAPVEAEVVLPTAPVEPPIPTPSEASPPLKAVIQRFKGNSPNFNRWLNTLEKAAKRTQDPAAMALVKEAKDWQAWQVVAQAQGGFAVGPQGPGVAPAPPPPLEGPGGPVEPAVLPPTTPPPAPGQPFQIQPARGVAPQPQAPPPPIPPGPAPAPPPAAVPPAAPTAPTAEPPANEMQPPPGEAPAPPELPAPPPVAPEVPTTAALAPEGNLPSPDVMTPPPGEAIPPGPPLAPSLDPQVAAWMDDIAKLEQLRQTVPSGPDHYAEREHFRNAINAIRQKMDRFEKRQRVADAPELFAVLEDQPLSALPKGDASVFRAMLPGTIEAHAPVLPEGRPDGWTPEMETALDYMRIDAAVREATGVGGNKLQRQKLSVLRATLANKMHESYTPEVIEKAREVVDQALKIRHLGDLLQPGVEVPGRHLRLGVGGPRVKVVEVKPSGVDFVVEGRAGERQTVSIDQLSGKNFQPYEELSSEATLKVAQELYEKSVAGTRKGELGAVKPGALLGLLGMAAATPLAIAFPAETMGAALLAGVGASLISSRIRNSSVAAWSLARATAAGRLSVAALNGAAAIGRIGLGALSDAAGMVGSMLIPGRRSAQFREEAEERIKAAVKSLNVKEGLHELLVGTAAAAQYDPKLWDQISRINPILAAKSKAYLDSQLSEDFAWKEIMEMAGVPRGDAERFHHFTQGHVDQKTIDRIGQIPAEMVSGMLVWNAAVDRVTRNAYVSIALAPLMKKYGVESLAELRDKVWRIDDEGRKHMLIPAEEYKDVEYAIDTAVTGAMNYSGGLTAEKVHLWRWMDPAIRAISALPLPVAMVLSPNVALFANYALANVPEVLLQHSPLFFLAPRFRASMEARGIQDKAYTSEVELKQLDEEWRAAKDFYKMEARRNAPLRKQDVKAYEEAMSNAQEWVDDAKEARQERGPELLKNIREWRKRRRSRYYNKQQIYGAFFASSLWLTGLALAYRLMRDEDGTTPLEIRVDKDEKGKSTVIDLKRLLGPLTFSWWLGDVAGRHWLNQQDPNKYSNITQWMHFPDIAKGLQDAMGYRNSPMDSLMEDLDLGTPEGVDKTIRTVVTQVGRLYSNFGGWVHDIYSGAEAAVHGLPPFFRDPMIEPTAMPPIPAGTGVGDVTKIIGQRAGGALARTMLPDWFGDLQEKMGVPESRRVHVADSWDKLLMERRPLMTSPLSWFFTMREQSALTRFMNDVQGAKLAEILPAATKVEWYDNIVNEKIAKEARDNGLFELIEDDSIPPAVRWQTVVDRMQTYRLEAHATAKRYADEHDLMLPGAAAFSDQELRDQLRKQEPGYRSLKLRQQARPRDYNLTPYEQRRLGNEQRTLTDELEINLPPYDLDGPPVQ